MLRVTPNTSADGTTKYFFGYYSEVELDPSMWHGKGAEKLNLKGEIKEKDFEAIANNVNPETGEQLTERNVKDRIVGYDFTFSVPKSVSLVYAMTKDKEILERFNSSVLSTMKEIEDKAETRVRVDGKNENRTTGNLVYGTFTHGESRPVEGVPDPHLHKHVFIFNATFDEDESKWKAGKFRNLKADAPYYEAVFRSHFASELKEIGYNVERNKNDFEIKDFDRTLVEKYSNRTKQIEEKAKELGLTFAEDKSMLGAKTRVQKSKDLDREELRSVWESRLTESERETVYGAKESPTEEDKNSVTPEEALDYSLAHNLERKSTVSEKDLYIHGLKRSYGSVSPGELKNELLKRKDLLSKEAPNGSKIFTTKDALKEEQDLVKSARDGRETLKPVNGGYSIKNEKLSPEQSNAVQHVLKSKDFITVVSGGAGTGKTWSIKEVAKGMEEKNVPFGAFAPSSAASRQVQRQDGFEKATTIADLLQNEKLQDSLKGGVLWIDEAGMVGNKTMNQIIDVAKNQEARILLTGDIKQHNAVERGDALRIVQKYGGIEPARISKIQRQKVEGYKSAVKEISDGNIESGLTALDSMKAIKEAETFPELKENVAKEYVDARVAKEETLIVATTHAQGRAVTETIRDKLKEEKILSGKERSFDSYKNLSFTDAQKQDLANYQKGMSVQFHQNIGGGINRGSKYSITGKDKDGNVTIAEVGADEKKKELTLPLDASNKFSVYDKTEIGLSKGDKVRITQNGFSIGKQRVNNGNILSVKGFDEQGNIIATTGRRDLVLDKNFGNLTHGYYTTSPASQGKSVNHVIVMQSSMSGKAASKEQFYVSASRGKFSISVHTDDKEALLGAVSRSTERMTASEIAADSGKENLQKIASLHRANKSKVETKGRKNYDKSMIKLHQKPNKIQPDVFRTRGK